MLLPSFQSGNQVSLTTSKSAPRVRTMTVEENHIINIDGSQNKPSSSSQQQQSKPVNLPHHALSGSSAANGATNRSLTEEIDEPTQHLLMADPEDPPHPGAQAGLPTMTGDQYVHTPGVHDSDTESVVSARSKTTSQLEEEAKMPWYRGVTCKDIRAITPTLLILLGGLLIMIFVIPYAFSSVIKQLKAEQLMEEAKQRELEARLAARLNQTLEAAATSTTLGPTISEGEELFENES